MKKSLSVFFAVIFVASAMLLPVRAQEKIDRLSVSFSDNIVGLTYEDYDKFGVKTSANITFDDDPILVADYTGSAYLGEIKPGRTYYIYYNFVAADGYELPEEINEKNVSVKCSDGCSVIWFGKTQGAYVDGKPSYGLMFYTEIKTPGSFFQKFFGKLADIFLKIKSWSLY